MEIEESEAHPAVPKITISNIAHLESINTANKVARFNDLQVLFNRTSRHFGSIQLINSDSRASVWIEQHLFKFKLWPTVPVTNIADIKKTVVWAHGFLRMVIIAIQGNLESFVLDMHTMELLWKLMNDLLELFAELRKIVPLEILRMGFEQNLADAAEASENWARALSKESDGDPNRLHRKLSKTKPTKLNRVLDPELRKKREEIEKLASTDEQRDRFMNEISEFIPNTMKMITDEQANLRTCRYRDVPLLKEWAEKLLVVIDEIEDIEENRKSNISISISLAGVKTMAQNRAARKIQMWIRRIRKRRNEEDEGNLSFNLGAGPASSSAQGPKGLHPMFVSLD